MWELSKLMNRLRDGGVTIDNFIRGKLDIIEAHNLQINVKFQSSFLPGDVISSSGMTFARNDNDGNYPGGAGIVYCPSCQERCTIIVEN